MQRVNDNPPDIVQEVEYVKRDITHNNTTHYETIIRDNNTSPDTARSRHALRSRLSLVDSVSNKKPKISELVCRSDVALWRNTDGRSRAIETGMVPHHVVKTPHTSGRRVAQNVPSCTIVSATIVSVTIVSTAGRLVPANKREKPRQLRHNESQNPTHKTTQKIQT